MINGWVPLFKKFIDWQWFKFPDTLQLFIYCLLKANYKDIKWKDIELKRGEFVTSFKSISEDTNLTIQQIRTSIKRLKSTSEITSKTTNKYTIITICKYDTYKVENISKQQAEQQATKQTNNKRTTTDKEYNNINNNKERKIPKDFSECSFVRNDFREVFKMWLDYKAEKKNSYKGERSAKICYDNIVKLSSSNVEVARKIIEQSIANNWDGLFELSKQALPTQPEPTKKGVTTWKAN